MGLKQNNDITIDNDIVCFTIFIMLISIAVILFTTKIYYVDVAKIMCNNSNISIAKIPIVNLPGIEIAKKLNCSQVLNKSLRPNKKLNFNMFYYE